MTYPDLLHLRRRLPRSAAILLTGIVILTITGMLIPRLVAEEDPDCNNGGHGQGVCYTNHECESGDGPKRVDAYTEPASIYLTSAPGSLSVNLCPSDDPPSAPPFATVDVHHRQDVEIWEVCVSGKWQTQPPDKTTVSAYRSGWRLDGDMEFVSFTGGAGSWVAVGEIYDPDDGTVYASATLATAEITVSETDVTGILVGDGSTSTFPVGTSVDLSLEVEPGGQPDDANWAARHRSDPSLPADEGWGDWYGIGPSVSLGSTGQYEIRAQIGECFTFMASVTSVGVDRVVSTDSSGAEVETVHKKFGTQVDLTAKPRHESSGFPTNYPEWKITMKPTASTLSTGTVVSTGPNYPFSPDVPGKYVLQNFTGTG